MSIALPDTDGEIEPVPTSGGGRKPEPELDLLSNILKTFNEMFGNIDWKDADKIGKVIAEELPIKVAANRAYQNAMKNSDKQNARIEHDMALERAVIELLSDHTELFKQFSDNPSFRKWGGVYEGPHQGDRICPHCGKIRRFHRALQPPPLPRKPRQSNAG